MREDAKSRSRHFGILYDFFRHCMQNLRPFYRGMTFFCRKSGNSCLLIFLETIPHYLPKDERILFFEVFIIFFYFLQNLKRRSTGGGVWSWCMTLSRRALGQSALRLS